MTITVTAERIVHGGRALARHNGLVVFIRGLLPTETAEVEILRQKKNWIEARVVRLLKASPQRIEPLCPVAHRCGGCPWQHMEYAEQLRQKEKLFSEALYGVIRRQRAVQFAQNIPTTPQISLDLQIPADITDIPKIDIRPIVPSPETFYYRNRVQLHVDRMQGQVGYLEARSHRLVPIEKCYIADERINAKISKIREQIQVERPMRQQMVRPGYSEKLSEPVSERLEIYADDTENISYKELFYRSEDTKPSFTQVNFEQNKNLIAAVLAALPKDLTGIIELYAGEGNFGLPILRAAQQQLQRLQFYWSTEWNIQSVEQARKKLTEMISSVSANSAEKIMLNPHLIENIHFEAFDVAHFLQMGLPTLWRSFMQSQQGDKASATQRLMILLDPPRVGCDKKVMELLLQLEKEIPVFDILYISCDPMTLARDIESLTQGGKFTIHHAQAFDMFPQTPNIESLTYLRHCD